MAEKKSPLQDDEILAILHAERSNALGEGDDLSEDRGRAYDYYYSKAEEGYLAQDLPPEPGQSKATSSDISDAVETVLPDLIEIFTAGDDVVTFRPTGEEDEEQAQQETDYVNHVFYNENDGWLTLYTNFKDALLEKTGVFKWWWEEGEDWEDFVFEDKTDEEWKLLKAELRKGSFELADIELDEIKPDPETGLYTFRGRKNTTYAKASVCTIPPPDFRVDRNAPSIREATWAGHRATPRAYELLEQDFDPEKVALLHDFDAPKDDAEDARKFVDDEQGSKQAAHKHDIIRRVEIWEYHIWLDADGDGKVECWKIITGNEDTVLLDKERINGIQFSVTCPFLISHQLYGRSLADLLIETQKIKTALMRQMLNAYYFGVNPRPEVAQDLSTRFTISDLMENKPGRPIRVKQPGAVNWKTTNATGESILPALEYMSTVAEGRTGVVRNAQGLNPDTLHDTAKGATELMSAAQRRVRMIARIFAETGVKDMFLGLHDLIVRHARKKATVRLRNEWVEVDPTKWGRRKDLTVEVGLGANTKTAELQFWGGYLTILQNAAGSGLPVGPEHVFNSVKKFLQAGNVKNPQLYFPEPPQEGEEQQGPPPNPEVIKAQGELQLKQQEAQQKAELQRAELQQKLQLQQQQFNFESQLAVYSKQVELGLAEQAAATEARLAEMAQRKEFQIAEFKAANEAQTKTMTAAISAKAAMKKADNSVKNVRPGGNVG